MSPGVAATVVAVGLGMFLVVWLVAGRLRNSDVPTRSSPGPSAHVAAPAQSVDDAANAAVNDSDPIVEESKRFIDRESRHAGLPEPPTASDGRVHLRGGGSISADQYRDAQRHVYESPVSHPPLPPPPVP